MTRKHQKDSSLSPFQEMYGHKVRTNEKDLHFLLKIGFVIMGTFLPLFAFFFFIIWKNDRPKVAKWPKIGFYIGASIYTYFVTMFVLVSLDLL